MTREIRRKVAKKAVSRRQSGVRYDNRVERSLGDHLRLLLLDFMEW